MRFSIKVNPVQCIIRCQYILADRLLRNSGYLVEHEVLSTFGCQFSSKTSFKKSKNIEVCLKLVLKWRRLDAFSHQYQPSVMHPMMSIIYWPINF